MPTVAPGLIAVAKGPISYTETDADGKPIADAISFKRGDVIHDESLVQTLHQRHFHHMLSATPHSPHLCPADCTIIGVVAAVETEAVAAVKPISQAPIPPTASTEVKS